jgi:hypothetical protein
MKTKYIYLTKMKVIQDYIAPNNWVTVTGEIKPRKKAVVANT